VTTGSEVYHGRIQDRFGPVVRKKVEALVLLRHITSGRGACVRLATSFGRKELIVNKVPCLHVHRLSYLIEQIEKNWPIASGGKPALSNRFPSATIGGIRSYDDDESFCLLTIIGVNTSWSTVLPLAQLSGICGVY
jgi:hypothetical protein